MSVFQNYQQVVDSKDVFDLFEHCKEAVAENCAFNDGSMLDWEDGHHVITTYISENTHLHESDDDYHALVKMLNDWLTDNFYPDDHELRIMRERAGLTQAQAAELVHLSTSGYQKIESGQRPKSTAAVYELLQHKITEPDNFDQIVELMDDDIREALHIKKHWHSKREFLDAYKAEHFKKYGERFSYD